MRGILALLITLPLCCPAADTKAWGVTTFESIGLYYNRPEPAGACTVRYHASGAREWREGYPLVYDQRERQYRGSLVELRPDTLYEIRLEAGGETVDLQARTRTETFPIGKTTFVPGGTLDQTLRITEGGDAGAWHLVTPAAGTKVVSDVFNLSDHNIVVEADYVILRGFELRNAAVHGILVRPGVQNVVVEDCHITGWAAPVARECGGCSEGPTARFLPSAMPATWWCNAT